LKTFKAVPTSAAVRAFLGRAIHGAGRAPKYLICDKGSQFWCPGFKRWYKRRRIKPRFGAVGKHGSIAVVERFILTLERRTRRRSKAPPHRHPPPSGLADDNPSSSATCRAAAARRLFVHPNLGYRIVKDLSAAELPPRRSLCPTPTYTCVKAAQSQRFPHGRLF
jgi:transposase InsO family protein